MLGLGLGLGLGFRFRVRWGDDTFRVLAGQNGLGLGLG